MSKRKIRVCNHCGEKRACRRVWVKTRWLFYCSKCWRG